MAHDDTPLHPLVARFRDFIADRPFPCVGAKSALHRGRLEFVVLDELGTDDSARRLCEALERYSARHPSPGTEPVSFVALFEQPVGDERAFHEALWRQLQAIHDIDVRRHPWDPAVSADVDARDFSFSVAERAYFVVGLHPAASRLARRAPCPALVFNFHAQFEAMKATGQYDKLQTAIRQRDIALQGDINPVLARFGEASEALQYSGRAGGGRCPFHQRAA